MKRNFALLSLSMLMIAVVVGAVVYVRFLYSPSMTTNQVGEITPDWNALSDGAWGPWMTDPNGDRVWAPALSFNTWVGSIPDHEQAWGILVELEHRPDSLAENPFVRTPPTTNAEWDTLSELLRDPVNQDQLTKFREALARDHVGALLLTSTDPTEHDAMMRHNIPDQNWDPNPELDPELLGVRYTSLGPIRNAVRVLDLATAVELRNGETDRFTKDIGLMLRASDLAVEYPVLISELVRIGILSVVHHRVVWALSEYPGTLSDEQLRELDSEIERHRFGTLNTLGEELSLHDTLRRVANEDGELAASASILTGGLNTYGSLDDPTDLEDSAIDDSLQRPLWLIGKMSDRVRQLSAVPWIEETQVRTPEIEREFDRSNYAGTFVMDMLLPSFENIPRNALRIQQTEIGVRTVIAIERHRLRHGSLPGSLDEIDEDLVSVDPIDVIANEPFRYRVEGESFVLYSIGDDRDDDGGVQRIDTNRSGNPRNMPPNYISSEEADEIRATDPGSIDGDWVLFPTPQTPSED
jgi:hypothetical protein